MTLQLAQLVQLWGPPLVSGGAAADLQVDLGAVCTDSRQLQQGNFFIPLRGERFDGHTFLNQAVQPVSYTHLTLPTTSTV